MNGAAATEVLPGTGARQRYAFVKERRCPCPVAPPSLPTQGWSNRRLQRASPPPRVIPSKSTTMASARKRGFQVRVCLLSTGGGMFASAKLSTMQPMAASTSTSISAPAAFRACWDPPSKGAWAGARATSLHRRADLASFPRPWRAKPTMFRRRHRRP